MRYPPRMRFALLSVSPYATASLLARVATIAERALPAIVAAWQPVFADVALPSAITVLDAVAELTDDDVPFIAVPALGAIEAASGFVAYHFLQPDEHGVSRPYGIILADAYMGDDGLARYLHEIFETAVDPTCARTLGGWDAEVCDPGQGRGGPFGGPAWVTPAWMLGGVGVRLVRDDGGGDLDAGVVAPNGYARRADGSQVPPGYRLPAHRDHAWSRGARRLRSLRSGR